MVGISALEQDLMDRWHGGIPGRAMLAERLPEARGRESVRHDYRAAGRKGRQRGTDQTVAVEERQHDEAAVCGRERIVGSDVLRREQHVGVSEGHDLGLTLCTAGMQEERDVSAFGAPSAPRDAG